MCMWCGDEPKPERCMTCWETPCECATVPPEPPVGTVVVDRYGAKHKRYADGWGDIHWGTSHLGVWQAMWTGRGPLEVEG